MRLDDLEVLRAYAREERCDRLLTARAERGRRHAGRQRAEGRRQGRECSEVDSRVSAELSNDAKFVIENQI